MKTFTCKNCNKIFLNPPSLYAHVGVKWACSKCGGGEYIENRHLPVEPNYRIIWTIEGFKSNKTTLYEHIMKSFPFKYQIVMVDGGIWALQWEYGGDSIASYHKNEYDAHSHLFQMGVGMFLVDESRNTEYFNSEEEAINYLSSI